MERLLVEAGQQQPQLLLEQLAVLLRVEQRRAEGLHLAGVIAAAHPHDDAAVGDDVGHGVVLRQPDRMPHRQDVEGAAELQAPGLGGEPQAELDQVREDFVALALEMVLGRPQHVESEFVHEPGNVARGEKSLAQPLVGIAPFVGGRAVEPDVVELDLADVEDVEVPDHRFLPGVGTLKRFPLAWNHRRHSGARAQPASPESITPAERYLDWLVAMDSGPRASARPE